MYSSTTSTNFMLQGALPGGIVDTKIANQLPHLIGATGTHRGRLVPICRPVFTNAVGSTWPKNVRTLSELLRGIRCAQEREIERSRSDRAV